MLKFRGLEAWAVNSFGFSLKGLRDKLYNEKLNKQIANETQILDKSNTDYFDKTHPLFSRELSIAIKAWEQVLKNNPARPRKGSRKKLISEWLEDNYKDLSGAAKDRIVIMIDPDEKGGAPKI